jgi:hypothetical protein
LSSVPCETHRAVAGQWGSLGAVQAVQRLVALAAARLGVPIEVPRQLLDETFELAVGHVITYPHEALECLHAVRAARVNVDRAMQSLPPLSLPEAQIPEEEDARLFTAACRLAVGELAESSARLSARAYTHPKRVSSQFPAKYSRLCFDSYAAALWSSAHAEYIIAAKEILRIMPPETNVLDVAIPPGPRTVAWAVTSLPDLVHLLERRGTPGASVSNAVRAMQVMLNRCTSPSARGWETVTNSVSKDAEGAMRVCAAACVSALCGMNQAIHPCARPTWEERMRIQRTVTFAANEPRKMIALCGPSSREAMRLFLATLLAAAPCVREALFFSGHPAGKLVISPFEACAASLQSSAGTLASIGKLSLSVPDIAPVLHSSFSEERREAGPLSAVLLPTVYGAAFSRPHILVKSPTAVHIVRRFVSDVFSAQFTPFWTVQNEDQIRVARLSRVQHDFFHKESHIHTLFDLLPKERQLFVQRVALTEPRALHMNLPDVALQLGHEPHDELEQFPAAAASEIVLFARVAALKGCCRSWELGPRIKALQTRALAKRLVSDVHADDDRDRAEARIPRTATHLCVCVPCRRVCNSMNVFGGRDLPHTDVGICAAVLRTSGHLSEGTMRCAKRSSAALRTALQLESEAESGTKSASHEGRQGPAPRLRRDRRNCLDQPGPAVCCGEEDLVLVPLLGNAVQIFGETYVMCCFCGVLVNAPGAIFFQGDPCCMRCDYKLCTRDRSQAATEEPYEELSHHHCRFCGKRDTLPKSASKWRSFHAPQDNLGTNAAIPAPLRRVVYCSSHCKPWIDSAHRSNMSVRCPRELRASFARAASDLRATCATCAQMAEIFAHLSLRIKPFMGASVQERKLLDFRPVMEGAAITKPSKLRRRKLLKRRV